MFSKLYPNFFESIIPIQHGSMKNKSLMSNLTCFDIDINDAFYQSSYIQTIYTEIAKALDKMDHCRLNT